MLAAIITLSLLSLLVATEADPTGSSAEPAPSEPLRPKGRSCCNQDGDKPNRLAA
jgi:hypothetical protein